MLPRGKSPTVVRWMVRPSTAHSAPIAIPAALPAHRSLKKAAWGARIAQGVETLHSHAIAGYTGPAGVMPARGGNPALSDDQVKATVDWMLTQLK